MTFDQKIRSDLIADEGIVYAVYLDHLGQKTCGIGHMCRPGEPEYSMPVGSVVKPPRVSDLFANDLLQAEADCRALFDQWDDLQEDVRRITLNMAFNLGRSRLAKFVQFRAAVNRGDWSAAADEMEDSRWAKQLPRRSARLISRMRSIV